MNEIWKPVVGFEGHYSVSNLGQVRSDKNITNSKAGHILKSRPDGAGYLVLTLCKQGRRKPVNIHRLVCIAFHGPPPSRHEVNHKNGNKLDNQARNLEWVTHSENGLHSRRVLGWKAPPSQGEANYNHKLTESQVREIRSLWLSRKKAKHTQAELAKMFDVALITISRIINRCAWKHI